MSNMFEDGLFTENCLTNGRFKPSKNVRIIMKHSRAFVKHRFEP